MRHSRTIQLLLAGVLVWLLAAGAAFAAPKPVVLELFTSNSCSSCPPAYSLLRDLQAMPPSDDVQLIVLSQHVTYWNDLGWVDRYSDKQFTNRQRHYAREVFGTGRVYTPQLVVNGQYEMVGSRSGEVRSAISKAAGKADLSVSLKVSHQDDRALNVGVTVDGDVEDTSQVWLALTQDNVVSEVGAGENGGRTLSENGVVRTLKPAGIVAAGSNDGGQRYNGQLTVPKGVARDDIAVVAFVQRRDSRVIVGAASQSLSSTGQQYGSR